MADANSSQAKNPLVATNASRVSYTRYPLSVVRVGCDALPATFALFPHETDVQSCRANGG